MFKFFIDALMKGYVFTCIVSINTRSEGSNIAKIYTLHCNASYFLPYITTKERIFFYIKVKIEKLPITR